MKFSVYFLIIVLSVVQCIESKGWNSAGYKDETTCSMGWSGYLKRLSLIIFMLSGVILYYVPDSRFYFRRGCHDIIDFVADGLQAGLTNTTDLDYTVDDSSSSCTEQESEETFGKQISCSSTDILAEDRARKAYDRERSNRIAMNPESSNESLSNRGINLIGSKRDRNESLDPSHWHLHHQKRSNPIVDTFSTQEYPVAFPFETIQLYPDEIIELEKFSRSRYFCPSEKDSDTSGAISREFAENRRKIVYSRDEEPMENSKHLTIAKDTWTEDKSVIESEPTLYPEEESIYNASDPENDNDCRRFREEIEKNFKTRTKLDEKLREFDRSMDHVRLSFSRKFSANSVDKEEYALRMIEAILQTVKRSFGEVEESEKNASRRRHRKSTCTGKISVPKRTTKTISSDDRDRKLVVGASGDHYFYPGSRSISKRKFHTGHRSDISEDSKKRYSNCFLPSENNTDVPIITNRVKPLIERAARWFFGKCSNMETEIASIGKEGIVDNDQREDATGCVAPLGGQIFFISR